METTETRTSTSNLHDNFRARESEDWVFSACKQHNMISRSSRRERSSNSFASGDTRRGQRRCSSRSNWNSVAREIEHVVFGESDEEEDDTIMDSEFLHGRRRRSRSRRRRRNSTRQPTPTATNSRRSRPRTHFAYDLFDNQQTRRRQTVPSSSSIIYSHKYQCESLFRPILILLSILSVTLLLVRIATNLLASGVGTAVFIPSVLIGCYKAAIQPFGLLHLLQCYPILFWMSLGASSFAMHSVMYRQIQSSYLSCTGKSSTACEEVDNGTYNDLVLLWGLFRGALSGLGIGSIWLIFLGNRSTKGLLRKALEKFCAESLEPRKKSNENLQHQCVICLDSIQANHVACILHPCSHCFHDECARSWFERKQTCPMCRVPVEGQELLYE